MDDDDTITIYPPLADGTWWLAYCSACEAVCGQACRTEASSRRQAAAHTTTLRHCAAAPRRSPRSR